MAEHIADPEDYYQTNRKLLVAIAGHAERLVRTPEAITARLFTTSNQLEVHNCPTATDLAAHCEAQGVAIDTTACELIAEMALKQCTAFARNDFAHLHASLGSRQARRSNWRFTVYRQDATSDLMIRKAELVNTPTYRRAVSYAIAMDNETSPHSIRLDLFDDMPANVTEVTPHDQQLPNPVYLTQLEQTLASHQAM